MYTVQVHNLPLRDFKFRIGRTVHIFTVRARTHETCRLNSILFCKRKLRYNIDVFNKIRTFDDLKLYVIVA